MITVLSRRGLFALMPSTKKSFVVALILLPSIIMWLYQLLPALRNELFRVLDDSPADTIVTNSQKDDEKRPEPIDLAAYPYNPRSNLSVNLVVATIRKEDISWTERLLIPNLNIVRYVSDDPKAQYHPPVAKGREALMYHTYLYDWYDNLPDVTIFVHAQETTWHTDPELWSSMLFTLSNLDLEAVVERGYANLRVSWHAACPDWINTTVTKQGAGFFSSHAGSTYSKEKEEEAWMLPAFRAIFGDDVEVPETVGGPCCSQFAVTRDAIRSRDRDVYARAMRWFIETDWSDYIAGRVWEHMWSFLFKRGQATDCPVEWKTFCRMYGVCFNDQVDKDDFHALWKEREAMTKRRGFWFELWDPYRAAHEKVRIAELDVELDRRLRAAMEKGRAEKAASRSQAELLGDLYVN